MRLGLSRLVCFALLLMVVALSYPLVAHAQGRAVEVTAAQANVRSGPGTRFRALGLLRRGTVLSVLSEASGWYLVSLGGTGIQARSGYLSGSVVRVVNRWGSDMDSTAASSPAPVLQQGEPPPVKPAPVFSPAVSRTRTAPPPVTSASRLHYGVYVSAVPWEISTQGSSVRLSSDADRSPLPSLIVYEAESRRRAFAIGLVLKRSTALNSGQTALQPILSLELTQGSTIRYGQVGVGGQGAFALSPNVRFLAGASAVVGVLWGNIGQVGSTQGDIYLIAPDDQRYERGALINVSSVPAGLEPVLGLEAGMGALSLRVEGGYRMAFRLQDWSYTVSDPDNEKRASELPARGFAENPPKLNQTGPFLRVGVLF